MALVLKQTRKVKSDGSELYMYDSTQEYINDPDGGWGTTEGGSIARSARCLLCFVIFTDEDGTETYTDHVNQYLGSDKSYSIADGNGLSNTDMSKFSVLSSKDGHYSFYLIPMERYSVGNAPGAPAAYYIYYNTTDGLVYIFYDSAYVLLAETHLQYLKSNSAATKCEQLYDVRIIVADAELTWNAVDTDYQGSATERAEKKWFAIWDAEERQKSAQLAFYGGSEDVARDMIKTLTNRS